MKDHNSSRLQMKMSLDVSIVSILINPSGDYIGGKVLKLRWRVVKTLRANCYFLEEHSQIVI